MTLKCKISKINHQKIPKYDLEKKNSRTLRDALKSPKFPTALSVCLKHREH